MKNIERELNDLRHLIKIYNKKEMPKVKKVLFKVPATIVFWEDGTKTVVRCCEEDKYDREIGLLLCVAKKSLGYTETHRILEKYIYKI